VTTSYLDEAERCDRVVLLDEGRTLALDTPVAVQASLSGRTLSIVTDRPRAARDALRSLDRVRSAHLFGEALHVRVDDGTADDRLRDALDQAGVAWSAFDAVRPSLEDVFMDRLGGRRSSAGAVDG